MRYTVVPDNVALSITGAGGGAVVGGDVGGGEVGTTVTGGWVVCPGVVTDGMVVVSPGTVVVVSPGAVVVVVDDVVEVEVEVVAGASSVTRISTGSDFRSLSGWPTTSSCSPSVAFQSNEP